MKELELEIKNINMYQLLEKLNGLNIKLSLKDDKLDIQAPKGVVNKELLEEIKKYKPGLISFLRDVTEPISIQKEEGRKHYPLSSAQKRLWLLHNMNPLSPSYHISMMFEIQGNLSSNKLKETFEYILEKHESLRTVFQEDEKGNPVQIIKEVNDLDFKFDSFDVGDGISDEYIQEFINKPFDLSNDCLLRICLLKKSDDKHVLLFVMHHIISDGWSIEVLAKDFVDGYSSISKPSNHERLNYKDYAIWEQKRIKSEQYNIAEGYWLSKFSNNDIPVLDIPTYQNRPRKKTGKGRTISFLFDEKKSILFSKLCLKYNTSLFMGITTLVDILLYKYSHQNDIIIGIPIANREQLELQDQIGFYANTLAIRTKINASESFVDLLKNNRQTLLEAYKYQEFPFDELVFQLNLRHDLSRNPLFDVMVLLHENRNPEALTIDNLIIKKLEIENFTSKFDLQFSFFTQKDILGLSLTFDTDLYNDSICGNLLRHLDRLFDDILKNPNQSIDNLDYLTATEKEQLLIDFNDTETDYPSDRTIIDLFEEQVLKTPDNIALVFEDKKLTYKELNEEANLLGDYLRQTYNIHPDDLITIKLDRSEKMIISILGILKSGGAYVPIDPDYPQNRISYILQDTKSKVTVDHDLLNKFSEHKKQYQRANLQKNSGPENLAYVIYTSGTTGQPKGVMIENRNVLRLVRPCDYLPLQDKHIFLSTGSISFDATIFEYFGTLLNGAELVLISNDKLLNPKELHSYINQKQINSIWMTASWFNQVIDQNIEILKNINQLIVGGDKLSPNHIDKVYLKYPNIKLVNGYGPTENTTFTTTFIIDKIGYKNIPIGRPISNTQVYILDKDLQPVPIGVTGKLYVSGAGLARGYLNKPELTAEKFIANLFIEGTRMYDTGDLGRWLPDGNIEFLGRDDFQVKIRGFRIELGEIESHLQQYSNHIEQVVADASEVNGEKVLVAYYTTDDSGSIDKSTLREYLQTKLPDYMVPGYFVELDQVPLTPNGKIDRKALPSVSGEDIIRKEYVAPRNETEAKLAEIWQEVLGIDKVGITDNFFELGGNSLRLFNIISKIKDQLSITLKFKEVYNNLNIQELSRYLYDINNSTIENDFVVENNKSYYQVSLASKRIAFEQFKNPKTSLNNIYFGIKIIGLLDIDKLKFAINNIVNRHEVLRTSFDIIDGEIVQIIHEKNPLYFKSIHLEIDEINTFISKSLKPFNINRLSLFRVHYIHTSKEIHHLLFDFHHSIFDGWSINIFFDELVRFYSGKSVTTVITQFKDLYHYENLENTLVNRKRSEIFWKELILNQPIKAIELPYDIFHPIGVKGITHLFNIEISIVYKIVNLAKRNSISLNVFYLSVFSVFLSKISNNKTLVFLNYDFGRDATFYNTIGMFVKTFPIYISLHKNCSFLDFLSKVNFYFKKYLSHNELDFEKSVNIFNEKGIDFTGKQNISFIYHDRNTIKFEDNILTIKGISNISHYSKSEFSFNFIEYKDKLSIAVHYNNEKFSLKKINQLCQKFNDILIEVVNNPMVLIYDIDI